MALIFWFIIIALILAAHCCASIEFYSIAKMKGWSGKKYLLIPAFLWLAGYLIIIALPDRSSYSMDAVISDDLPKL